MRLIIPLVVFTVVTDTTWSQSEHSQTDKAGIPTSAGLTPTDKPRRDDLQDADVALRSQKEMSTAQDENGRLNHLWLLKPQTLTGINVANVRRSQKPHSVTKLAKTLYYGFNPYFSKDYFEPFERRTKPVTVLALKTKEPILRLTNKPEGDKTPEVAEMQSPYNEINNFWNGPADNLPI